MWFHVQFNLFKVSSNLNYAILIDLELLFSILIILLGTMYLFFFFIRNRYVFFIMHIPISLVSVAYNNLPMTVVSLISALEKLGANLVELV